MLDADIEICRSVLTLISTIFFVSGCVDQYRQLKVQRSPEGKTKEGAKLAVFYRMRGLRSLGLGFVFVAPICLPVETSMDIAMLFMSAVMVFLGLLAHGVLRNRIFFAKLLLKIERPLQLLIFVVLAAAWAAKLSTGG